MALPFLTRRTVWLSIFSRGVTIWLSIFPRGVQYGSRFFSRAHSMALDFGIQNREPHYDCEKIQSNIPKFRVILYDARQKIKSRSFPLKNVDIFRISTSSILRKLENSIRYPINMISDYRGFQLTNIAPLPDTILTAPDIVLTASDFVLTLSWQRQILSWYCERSD